MQARHPAPSAETSAVERLIADASRQPEARARLAELLCRDPSTLAYVSWSRRLPEFAPARRVALLSSYTVETMAPFVAVEAYLSRWRAAQHVLQYSHWQTALLEPAAALDGCDAVVLLLDETAITGQLAADGLEAAAALTSLLAGFRARSHLPLFIGLIPPRPNPHAVGFGHATYLEALSRLQLVNAAIASFCLGNASSYVLDVPGALAAQGPNWHDAAAFAANLSYVASRAYPALARAIARAVGGLLVPRHKVLVTDLDGTLWGGILGEEGIDGIATGEGRQARPFARYQRFLKQLRASGVILAIASKNDEAHVREAFAVRARDLAIGWDEFAVAKVNWREKSAGLQEMADELGLGLDSFVFVDDSSVECAAIRHALPMVTVIPAPPDITDLPERILASRAFDALVISGEDRTRADQYRTERTRREATVQAANVESFLASLDLKVALSPFGPANAERIHQLLLKTNQFHLTLERPAPGALADRLAGGSEIYSVHLIDRFGDYGIIGVVELAAQPPAMRIRNLALSCRALGRRVEEAILAFAAERARAKGCSRLEASYVSGPRNHLIADALRQLGFQPGAENESGRAYALVITASHPVWPGHVARHAENQAA